MWCAGLQKLRVKVQEAASQDAVSVFPEQTEQGVLRSVTRHIIRIVTRL